MGKGVYSRKTHVRQVYNTRLFVMVLMNQPGQWNVTGFFVAAQSLKVQCVDMFWKGSVTHPIHD